MIQTKNKLDLNDLKQIPIKEVLQHFNIEVKGNQFRAVWRNEKTASVSISNDYFFKDFGSDVKGSSIDLYMTLTNRTQSQLNEVCQEMQRVFFGTNSETKKGIVAIQPITQTKQLQANQNKSGVEFTEIYKHFLKLCPLTEKAKTYIRERGLTFGMLEALNFGYLDSKNIFHIVNSLKKHFELSSLKSSGLFNDQGNFAYYFYDSLVIPYLNVNEDIENLQFRYIGEAKTYQAKDGSERQISKYRFLNGITKSTYLLDTILQVLNNHNQENDKSLVFITEGVFDCIAGYEVLQSNSRYFDNYIITGFALGSAGDTNKVSDNQIKQLLKANLIIFCLDNDKAGNEALDKLNIRFKLLGGTDKQIQKWSPPDNIHDLNDHLKSIKKIAPEEQKEIKEISQEYVR